VCPPEPTAHLSNLVGRTLGHFQIEAKIGEGGMGVVYRAMDERLRRPVALKVLPDDAVRDEARRRRFLREARSAAAVVHANVAVVHEVDESNGHVYIAMELVVGPSLRLELSRGRLPIGECVRIAKGMARALAKAHEKGIVHRDLKPDNVMLNEDREVKVLDFGLAKLLEPDEASAVGTDETASYDTANRLVGTPAYMSPEQATGKPVDARSDVFSFGVILYEMLTGKRPFGGTSPMETLVSIARDDAESASSLVPLPPAIERILLACLRKKPSERYASGRELAAALDAFDSGQYSPMDIGSQPTEIAGSLPSADTVTKESARRDARRTWRRVAAGVASTLAIAGAVWVVTKRAPGPTLSAPAAPTASVKPEAAAIFAKAEHEEREGRVDLACADYPRASDADPSYAEAALGAMRCHSDDPVAGRTFFRRAWAARNTLPPNREAFLEAEEAIYQRDPADEREALERLRAAVTRFPDDPALHFAIGLLAYSLGSYKEEIVEVDQSLRLDPNQPHALELLSDNADYNGDFARGEDAIEKCLKLIPGEIGCIEERAWVEGLGGQCAAMEGDARRMLAVEPRFDDATQILANALYAQGSSNAAIREVLKRKTSHEQHALGELRDGALVDALAGDFVSAEKQARAWADSVKSSTLASAHGEVARLLVLIDLESGHLAQAATDATSYLDAHEGWDRNARFEDWAMAQEPTPLMLATQLHAGTITQAAFDRERARTVAQWEARVVPHLRNFVWIWAYAATTETADEAKLAMAMRASYMPVPPFAPLALVDADIGRTYFLAGDLDDALPALERASNDCSPVDRPIEHTRASYFLGLAREAKGDTAGACAAYGVVRDRWGSAKPQSVTAQKAVARLRSLGCDGNR
jgi:serine/threonine-protein kinase